MSSRFDSSKYIRYTAKSWLALFFLVCCEGVWGQTNPTPHDLSLSDYVFNGFASGTTTTYPPSMQGWRFDLEPNDAFTGTPTADRVLVVSTSSPTTGSIRNEIGEGLSFLNSSSNNIGAIAIAVNTSGRENIRVTWTAEDVRNDNTRVSGIRLQYRIGTTGNFTEVPLTAYISDPTNSSPEQTFAAIALPSAVNDESIVQIRWLYYNVSGSGSRDRIRLDDISVTSDDNSGVCAVPNVHALGINITGLTSTSTNISWTNGNGTRRVLVMKESSDVNANPTDNTTYAGSTIFGNGSEIGLGNFVILAGTANASTITNLIPGTTYFAKIFEYSCSIGNELYLTTGSPASASFITEPSNPSFNPLCSSSTEIVLEWDNPTEGNWDGFVVLGRQGGSPSTINTSDPATLSPNADFGLGQVIGVNTVLYRGSGNSLTVTGIAPGMPYTFKVLAYSTCTTCINPFEYSTGTQISGVAELNDVVNFSSTAQATSVELGWNFSAGCADEIIVAASQMPITGTPTGPYSVNSPSFTDPANPILNAGEVVVYSGLGNAVTVTNLTTDTEYCFKAFLRRGSEWSDGVSVCETASATTIFEPGDLSIVAINASAQSPEQDEVCFIAYRTISTGTTIDLTDNGYERLTAGFWADTEGVIRLERTGPAIAPGTTTCMLGDGNSDAQLSVLTCGTDDGGWSISSLNGTSNFALNDEDQVWIMQGGNWLNPTGAHNATYSGNVLYGWTAVGWQSNPGYNSTSGSTLFPNSTCLNTDLQTLSEGDRVKYTGPTAPATKTGFIQLINDAANWTGYATDASYFSTSPLYSDQPCITFDILPFVPSPGEWTGTASNDWLDCLNWEDLLLPTSSVDVNIPGSATNMPEIAGPNAECHDLIINTGASIGLIDPSASLDIYGNVVLDGPFGASYGTVSFLGTTDQALTVVNGMGASTLNCNNLVINKPSGRVLAEGVINVGGNLNLQEGIIDLLPPFASLFFGPTSTVSGGSQLSFINGPASRSGFTAAQESLFPVGYFEPGLAVYQPASLTSTTDISATEFRVQYFHETFNDGFQNIFNPPRTPDLNVVSTCNYWTIDRVGSDNVRVGLSWNEANCFEVTDPDALKVARYSDTADEWEDAPFTPGVSQTNSGGPDFASGWVTTTQTVNNFSPFAIGSIGNDLNVLPITLISFSATALSKNLVETRWSTASETNNDYFTVERSRDAVSWEPVGIEIGAGTSNTQRDYRLDDDAPISGLSYYRLKQTDFDGSFAYSHTVPVNIGDFSTDFDLIKAYRDGNQLALLYTAERPQIRLELYSMVGQLLHSQILQNTDGFALVDLPELAHGVYVVRISSGPENAAGKFFF